MTMGDGDPGECLSPDDFPRDMDTVDPVVAVMMADAQRSLVAYPDLLLAGALFTAAERVRDGWQVIVPADPLPQGARDLLAGRLREQATTAPAPAAADLLIAARALYDGGPQEVSAGDRRFRIMRVEQFVRTGADGPEPPRPTDPDPEQALPWYPRDVLESRMARGRVAEELIYRFRDASPQITAAYPELAFMEPTFIVAERTEGHWQPVARVHSTPQQARESLATYFRHIVPTVERPDENVRAEFTTAADLIADGQRRSGITVAGRRFRIVRIDRVVRMGADGPEPPHPEDYSPS